MKKLLTFLFSTLILLGFGAAHAQQFSVATGAKSGTYSKMFQNFSAACQQDAGIPFVEVATSGSIENLDKLLTNQVPAAIVQIDSLHFRARTEDLSKVKMLFPLHPEEVHLIARSAPRMEGGVMGIGQKEAAFNALSNLKGRKVAAWGGGLVTAQVIRLQSEIQFLVAEVGSQSDAMKALDQGAVDAVLAVGGSPIEWVSTLGRNYKLLSIGEVEIAKLKNVYSPGRLSYGNLGQSGVATVATQAAMITRDYKTPAFVTMLTKTRTCFLGKLPELQETPGNHAKWSQVDPNGAAKWPIYEGGK
jgi:uncharacterized protein